MSTAQTTKCPRCHGIGAINIRYDAQGKRQHDPCPVCAHMTADHQTTPQLCPRWDCRVRRTERCSLPECPPLVAVWQSVAAFPDLNLSDEFRKGMNFALTVAEQEIARLRQTETVLRDEITRLRRSMSDAASRLHAAMSHATEDALAKAGVPLSTEGSADAP